MNKSPSAREETDYVLEAERGQTDHTTWKVRALTMLEQNPIMDLTLAFQAQHGSPPVATLAYMATKAALRGFDHYRTPKGLQVEWATDRDGRVSDSVLEALPLNVRIELANAITDLSDITGEDAKNLG